MPFQKGQSGNPGGRPKTLIWKEALQTALARKTNKPLDEALALVAGVVVDAALEGNLSAIKEIAERVDGKSVAQVAVSSSNGGFFFSQESVAEINEMLSQMLT